MLGEEAARRYLGHSHVSVTQRYLDVTKIKSVNASSVLPRPSILLPRPDDAGESPVQEDVA
jgi:hypothetical protein